MSQTNSDFNPLYAGKVLETSEASLQHLSGLSTRTGNRFYDNSTLDSFRVCPRRFYYRHIRHWETDSIRPALIFGTCWHTAMDYVWTHPGCSASDAFQSFMQEWSKSDLVDSESFDLFPRSPQRANEMLAEYIKRYQSWLENNIELIDVEKAFIVPLSDENQNLFYVGKWDKVYKEGRFFYICDHKTSSSFASTWLNSWSPNGQVDGYLYGGHMTYGDDFRSVMIDGALVQKTKLDFLRVPVERQAGMLDQWKWEVLDLIEQIWFYEDLLNQYRRESRHEPFLRSYPKCTTSCTSYYGACPYINLCKFVPNPEDIETEPDGFIITNWKPFNIEESPTGEFIVHHTHGD